MEKITEIVGNDDLEIYSVHKRDDGTYEVRSRSQVRHAPCSAEDVIRALSHYLQSAIFENEKLKGY